MKSFALTLNTKNRILVLRIKEAECWARHTGCDHLNNHEKLFLEMTQNCAPDSIDISPIQSNIKSYLYEPRLPSVTGVGTLSSE